MITKISVIGTMENGETKTASVSVKGRELPYEKAQKLFALGKVTIQANIEDFKEVKVCLEMRKRQWTKPYKASMIHDDLPNGNIDNELQTILNVLIYQMTVGKFKDCIL